MNKSKFKVACVQLNTRQSINRNLKHSTNYILEAIGNKANFIVTPEATNFMSSDKKELIAKVEYEKSDVFLNTFKKISYENSVWILIGSLIIKDDKENIFNRSYLISDKGKIVSKYDKIHMFDANISKKEKYNESSIFTPGKKTISHSLPWGQLGMTICYDLRFPGLYRKLSQQGAIFLSVPSAFTVTTGKKHWLSLIKARAIENGAFVFAPAQCGANLNNRKTYGHSLIIDPWGEILACADSKPGIIYAIIKSQLSTGARKTIPSLLINNRY